MAEKEEEVVATAEGHVTDTESDDEKQANQHGSGNDSGSDSDSDSDSDSSDDGLALVAGAKRARDEGGASASAGAESRAGSSSGSGAGAGAASGAGSSDSGDIIQVDFSFEDPKDIHYLSVKRHLSGVLPGTSSEKFPVHELADVIVKQASVGTMITADTTGDAYAFLSAVNIHLHRVSTLATDAR